MALCFAADGRMRCGVNHLTLTLSSKEREGRDSAHARAITSSSVSAVSTRSANVSNCSIDAARTRSSTTAGSDPTSRPQQSQQQFGPPPCLAPCFAFGDVLKKQADVVHVLPARAAMCPLCAPQVLL